jgi:hypothetical protein
LARQRNKAHSVDAAILHSHKPSLQHNREAPEVHRLERTTDNNMATESGLFNNTSATESGLFK